MPSPAAHLRVQLGGLGARRVLQLGRLLRRHLLRLRRLLLRLRAIVTVRLEDKAHSH